MKKILLTFLCSAFVLSGAAGGVLSALSADAETASGVEIDFSSRDYYELDIAGGSDFYEDHGTTLNGAKRRLAERTNYLVYKVVGIPAGVSSFYLSGRFAGTQRIIYLSTDGEDWSKNIPTADIPNAGDGSCFDLFKYLGGYSSTVYVKFADSDTSDGNGMQIYYTETSAETKTTRVYAPAFFYPSNPAGDAAADYEYETAEATTGFSTTDQTSGDAFTWFVRDNKFTGNYRYFDTYNYAIYRIPVTYTSETIGAVLRVRYMVNNNAVFGVVPVALSVSNDENLRALAQNDVNVADGQNDLFRGPSSLAVWNHLGVYNAGSSWTDVTFDVSEYIYDETEGTENYIFVRAVNPALYGNGPRISDVEITTYKENPVSQIAVSSVPKTEFKEGEAFTVGEGALTVTRQDGRTETVALTADMVSGYDMTKLNQEQFLTVTYKGLTTTYSIMVESAEADYVTKIALDEEHLPATAFTAGDSFTVGGGKLKVWWWYGKEETIDLTEDMASGYDMNLFDVSQTVTIEYKGAKVQYEIVVSDPVAGISLDPENLPKSLFVYGQSFSVGNGGIIVIRKSGAETPIAISSAMVSGYDMETVNEEQAVTVTYEGYTAEYTMKVVSAAVDMSGLFYYEADVAGGTDMYRDSGSAHQAENSRRISDRSGYFEYHLIGISEAYAAFYLSGEFNGEQRGIAVSPDGENYTEYALPSTSFQCVNLFSVLGAPSSELYVRFIDTDPSDGNGLQVRYLTFPLTFYAYADVPADTIETEESRLLERRTSGFAVDSSASDSGNLDEEYIWYVRYENKFTGSPQRRYYDRDNCGVYRLPVMYSSADLGYLLTVQVRQTYAIAVASGLSIGETPEKGAESPYWRGPQSYGVWNTIACGSSTGLTDISFDVGNYIYDKTEGAVNYIWVRVVSPHGGGVGAQITEMRVSALTAFNEPPELLLLKGESVTVNKGEALVLSTLALASSPFGGDAGLTTAYGVFDSSGKEIESSGTRFVAAKTGSYTVRITVTDANGNSAEKTVTVNVVEAPSQTEKENETGCGSSVGGGLAVLTVAVCAAFVGRRKRSE